MQGFVFLLIGFIIVLIVAYRNNNGENVYKYISQQVGYAYNKYAPYSFRSIREKVKQLGQEYTPKQYAFQITVFAVSNNFLFLSIVFSPSSIIISSSLLKAFTLTFIIL